jgi:hypothetical protein
MMMARWGALIVAAALLSACVTTPISGTTGASGAGAIPSTPLNLGDWRRATPNVIMQHFEREVSARYALGQRVSAISEDLRRAEFACASNRDTSGRGDPPNQICRRTVTVEGCTHTWQVHLYGDNALTRSRALYDRRCGGDGLLGGPS